MKDFRPGVGLTSELLGAAADIGDGGDDDARRLQIERRLIGIIARCHDHGLGADLDAVAVQIGVGRPG